MSKSEFPVEQLGVSISGPLPIPGPSADRDQLKNAKIAVLRLINENKDILFGKLSDSVSREAKEAKWAEVADHAHALGAFPSHRSWDYLKDTTWQNWRKRFVEKRERRDKYESTGIGTKVTYDEADIIINEILEALGRNMPTSHSSHNYTSPNNSHFRDISEVLEIEFDTKADDEDLKSEIYEDFSNNEADDGAPNSNYSSVNLDTTIENVEYVSNGYHDDDDDMQEFIVNETKVNVPSSIRFEGAVASSHPKIVSTSSLSSATPRTAIVRKYASTGCKSGAGLSRKRPANFLNNVSPIKSIDRELTELKCRKIRAELELLDREAYKKDLEILQLERSLGLPASYITRKFYNRSDHALVNKRLNR